MREATLFSDRRSSIRLKSRRGRGGAGEMREVVGGEGEDERGSRERPRWFESGSLNMGVAS